MFRSPHCWVWNVNWWVPTNGGGWKVDKWGDSASNGIYGDFQGTRGDKLEIQWGACMEVSHSFQHSGELNFELEAGSVLGFKKCYWYWQKVYNYQFTDTFLYRRQINHLFEMSRSQIKYGPKLLPGTAHQLSPWGPRLSNRDQWWSKWNKMNP